MQQAFQQLEATKIDDNKSIKMKDADKNTLPNEAGHIERTIKRPLSIRQAKTSSNKQASNTTKTKTTGLTPTKELAEYDKIEKLMEKIVSKKPATIDTEVNLEATIPVENGTERAPETMNPKNPTVDHYDSLDEWLELTGFHDRDFRERALGRHIRTKKLEDLQRDLEQKIAYIQLEAQSDTGASRYIAPAQTVRSSLEPGEISPSQPPRPPLPERYQTHKAQTSGGNLSSPTKPGTMLSTTDNKRGRSPSEAILETCRPEKFQKISVLDQNVPKRPKSKDCDPRASKPRGYDSRDHTLQSYDLRGYDPRNCVSREYDQQDRNARSEKILPSDRPHASQPHMAEQRPDHGHDSNNGSRPFRERSSPENRVDLLLPDHERYNTNNNNGKRTPHHELDNNVGPARGASYRQRVMYNRSGLDLKSGGKTGRQ